MLQRIQSVFLLLAAAAMLVASVTPLLLFMNAGQLVKLEALGVYAQDGSLISSTWGLFALGALSSIIALLTIFLFKNRILQMRISVINIIIMLGFYGFLAFLVFQSNSEYVFHKIGIGVVMPIIAIILTWLAIRKIGQDETLVRSLNRLR